MGIHPISNIAIGLSSAKYNIVKLIAIARKRKSTGWSLCGTSLQLISWKHSIPRHIEFLQFHLHDHNLLKYVRKTDKSVIISSGMSTMEQIKRAVEAVGEDNLVLMHSTSSYPCKPEEFES